MASGYDLIAIGGGLGGSALAVVMAEQGARVLVLERETRFKDRVRGEALFPWGAAEMETLGLRVRLLSACGNENRWWDDYLGSECIGHRDTIGETPGGTATLTFYHPAMQETLLQAAAGAGAEVWRGARVGGITPGRPVQVAVEAGGRSRSLSARFAVAADGRESLARRWGGFTTQAAPRRLRIAGVLFDGMGRPAADTTRMIINPEIGRAAILIPQGSGRVRAYVAYPSGSGDRFSGGRDVPRFIAEAVRIGIDAELFEGARPAGPLATFEGADRWVDWPYRDGVALVGDAAAASDPSWGQGLSLTVRDVRLLSQALLEHDDWERAGGAYAEGHDRGYQTIRATEELFTTFFLDTGPEADARRERALPLFAAEPDRVPDAFMSGPDAAPLGPAARSRFFGEI